MNKEMIIKFITNEDWFKARYAIDEMLSLPSRKAMYHKNVIKRAVQFIEKNYHKKIKLDDVAECVGFSKEYLSRVFKENMYMNYRNYINFVRIRNAENLLLKTKLPIKEVARKIGFDDSCYFTRIFKKVNGCTPVKFRSVYSLYEKIDIV